MKYIIFEITMPGTNTWNGRWSGQNSIYAKKKSYSNDRYKEKGIAKIVEKGNFHYDFGDGWRANVNVREVTAKEANKIMKISAGFMGYEWMIDSIFAHNEILKPIYDENRKRINY